MTTKNKNKSDKLWGGRFGSGTHKLTEELNASLSFDKRLYKYDITGSIAHAKTLNKAKILTKTECKKIIKGLKSVELEIDKGKFFFNISDEDIHMAIEKRLTEKVGSLGGKLHTGRSRNDQVTLDITLFVRHECEEIIKLIHNLQKTLLSVSEKNSETIMPGYTHLQRAQPITLGHHLIAYIEMLDRDKTRFKNTLSSLQMPLGSGALAGSPYDLDRNYTAKLLGFKSITANSMDGVSNRDFILEVLFNSSTMMMHLSRLSEELILWSSQEFNFIELSDEFSTGSSIMPQKKNPDLAELARGKTGRVYGNLVSLLTTMKALPLAYNKDMQEDKEPLFDTVDTVKAILEVYSPMIKSMTVNKTSMSEAVKKGFLNATDLADYLVGKGLTFRASHEVSGKAVGYCIKAGLALEDLSMEEFSKFSKLIDKDIYKALKAETSVNSRTIKGGTAFKEVKKNITKLKARLKKI